MNLWSKNKYNTWLVACACPHTDLKLIYREKVMSRETYALRKVVHDEESAANKEREVW